MRKKRFIGLLAFTVWMVSVFVGQAWSGARDDVVAYARKVLDWEWKSDGYILLHYSGYLTATKYNSGTTPSLFGGNRPLVVTGDLKGVPYSLSANGNGKECTLEEYQALSDAQRQEVSSIYGYGNDGYTDKDGVYHQPEWQYWRVSAKYGMSCATFVWSCVSQALDVERTAMSPSIPTLWKQYLNKTSYSELQKGDILQKSAHVMLVVDNNPAESKLTVIEQTPPDLGSRSDLNSIYISPYGYYNAGLSDVNIVGTREKVYEYSEIGSYTAYAVDYGDYESDPEPVERVSPGLLNNSPIYAYTQKYDRYTGVYTNKYLTSRVSSTAWTGEDDEDWLLKIGRNSNGVAYAKISYPISSGRREAYVNLNEVFVPGELTEDAKTAKKDFTGLYRRRSDGYDSSYKIKSGSSAYVLTKDNGWYQILYPDTSGSYWRIAWLSEADYNDVFGAAIVAPEITTTNIGPIIVDQKITQKITATGENITWDISGSLPPGLNFDKSTGTISGTATSTTASKYNIYATAQFEIIASNAGGSSRKSYLVIVLEKPSITTGSTLANALVNEQYTAELEATGSSWGMSWKVKSGYSLPEGLSLEADGHSRKVKITGTPSKAGNYSFVIQAASGNKAAVGLDDPSMTTEKTFYLNVSNPEPLGLTPKTLPEAVVGKPYNTTLKVTGASNISVLLIKGDKSPYSWSDFSLGSNVFDYSYKGNVITISGEPKYSAEGKINIDVAIGATDEIIEDYQLKIVAPEITGTFINGTVGQQYESSVAANWSSKKYSWTRHYSLPTTDSGYMNITYSGAKATISGIPNKAGKYPLVLKVTDDDNFTITKDFYIEIADKPEIKETFSGGTTGESYSSSITVTGGTAPYIWSFVKGNLPQGINPSYSGATASLSGTTEQTGSCTFTLQVEDNCGAVATKEFTLGFYQPLAIEGTLKNSATQDNDYDASFGKYYSSIAASGGVAPYEWEVIDGTLPDGLDFDQYSTYATLSGYPEKAGNYSFTVRLSDSNGSSTTKKFGINVASMLEIVKETLKDTTAGAVYSDTVSVSGGVAPYNWELLNGKYPDEFNLSFNGAVATISGVSEKSGSYSFVLRVTDANGAVTDLYCDFSVEEPLFIEAPDDDEKIIVGKPFSLTYFVDGGSNSYTWKYVGENIPGVNFVDAKFKATLSGTPEQAGEYPFKLRVTDSYNAISEFAGTLKIFALLEITSAIFPDNHFRYYVLDYVDTDSDGYLSDEEIAAVKEIDVSNQNVANLKGIEIFTNLEKLDCQANELSALDVSNNTALKWLYCNDNNLSELVLGNNSVLEELNCENNSSLATLDIQGCPKLLSNNNILADAGLSLITGEDLPEFGGSTLVLDGKIGINFYVYIPEAYNPEDCYMVFESRRGISNENSTEKYNPEAYAMRRGKKYYAYTCYINSAQMAEEVTATFYFNGKTITKKDSVDAYLTLAEQYENQFSDNVNNLMRAIRNYGHYVQPMLAINGNWAIGDKYAEMRRSSEITTADIEEAKSNVAQYAKVEYKNSIGITRNAGYSLNLDTETILNISFTPEATYTGSVSITVNGNAHEVNQVNENGTLKYKLEIKNISAPDLNKKYSVIAEANGINMLEISAMSYTQAVLNTTLTSIGNVPIDVMQRAVTALYRYHAAAKTYFDSGKQ